MADGRSVAVSSISGSFRVRRRTQPRAGSAISGARAVCALTGVRGRAIRPAPHPSRSLVHLPAGYFVKMKYFQEPLVFEFTESPEVPFTYEARTRIR